MSFELRSCQNLEEWNEFVISSPQYNIFCHGDFLSALSADIDLWFLEKDGEIQAALPVVKENGQPLRHGLPYTLYQGFMFSSDSDTLAAHSQGHWMLEVLGEFLERLKEKYSSLFVCQHPDTHDLRALQWFHYHEPELGQFKIDLRYTGIMNLGTVGSFEHFFKTVRDTRRQEYNKAKNLGLKVERSNDVGLLNELHKMTFDRQGLKRSEQEEDFLVKITKQALAKEYGELLVCRSQDGLAVAANLFLFDKNAAYYLFGANHPEYRKLNGGTFLFLSSVENSFNRNVKQIDVVGINSPNRGDFKTSFNAIPKAYFQALWVRPS